MKNPCMAAEHINPRKHHLRRCHRTPKTHTMSHITVERNRRRQMNDHLKVLRSLTPCFYIKKELVASCNSPIADVEAKISGSNVVLRVISKRTHGQLLKIISTLEKLSFKILHLNISSMDDTVLYYFVVKIGLECQLSMEELAAEVQRCFCTNDTINKITEI
uniref:BHLH domain-containing protein n=1 Tax=Chenopodium quinoa TaxID=63459 RepID=A0A803LAH7_CHEQI